MSEKPISPLRQRMIEDMSVRNFGEKTRNDYIRHVRTFTAFLGRSPDTATAEDLRRFQLHQSKTGVRPPTINGSVAALLLHCDARSGKRGAAPYVGARAAQDAVGLESRRDCTPAGGGTRTEVQGRTERGLRRRTAGLRGGGTQGVRRRLQANAAADRTGQGAEGSLCDALASAARSPAPLADIGHLRQQLTGCKIVMPISKSHCDLRADLDHAIGRNLE